MKQLYPYTTDASVVALISLGGVYRRGKSFSLFQLLSRAESRNYGASKFEGTVAKAKTSLPNLMKPELIFIKFERAEAGAEDIEILW